MRQWYAKEQVALANDFVRALAKRLEEIQQSPRRFALLETVITSREIRRAQLSRFPYLVVYELLRDKPIVLAIMHTSRDPHYWLERAPGKYRSGFTADEKQLSSPCTTRRFYHSAIKPCHARQAHFRHGEAF